MMKQMGKGGMPALPNGGSPTMSRPKNKRKPKRKTRK